MARPIWNGSISFGLVSIPVGLYAAEEEQERLRFNLLDRRDMSPVGQRKFNKRTGEEVPADCVVKGYQHERDRYVIVEEDALKAAIPKSTQTVEIRSFVDPAEIESVYWGAPYYLVPGKHGLRPFVLLREALRRTGQVGIARVVLRTREHVASVGPRGDLLVLQLLRYHHELRGPESVIPAGMSLDGKDLPEKELKLAQQLVDALVAPWRPEDHRNVFHEEVKALIRERIEAGETRIVAEPLPEPKGEVIDIATLLKRSVESAREEQGGRTSRTSA